MCAIPKMRTLTEKNVSGLLKWNMESNAILRFLSYHKDVETPASLEPFFCECSSLNILLIGYKKHFVFLVCGLKTVFYLHFSPIVE